MHLWSETENRKNGTGNGIDSSQLTLTLGGTVQSHLTHCVGKVSCSRGVGRVRFRQGYTRSMCPRAECTQVLEPNYCLFHPPGQLTHWRGGGGGNRVVPLGNSEGSASATTAVA